MNRCWSTLLIVSLLLAPLTRAMSAPVRIWTSSRGTTIKAELVKIDGDIVVLKNETGREVRIARKELSKFDQVFLSHPVVTPAVAAPGPGDPNVSLKNPNLGFKGLHLKMTREEVNALVTQKKWSYHFSSNPESDSVFLSEGFSSENNIQHIGGTGKQKLSWHRVSLKFKNDIVQQVGLHGADVPTEDIDKKIDDWLAAAQVIVSSQHGKPTSSANVTTRKFQMLSALSKLGSFEVAKWNVGSDQQVSVRAMRYEGENKYCGQILYRIIRPRKKSPVSPFRR